MAVERGKSSLRPIVSRAIKAAADTSRVWLVAHEDVESVK